GRIGCHARLGGPIDPGERLRASGRGAAGHAGRARARAGSTVTVPVRGSRVAIVGAGDIPQTASPEAPVARATARPMTPLPRTGRRGPRARTWTARGDPWTWFPQVIRERKQREGDPVAAALEALLADTTAADDAELEAVHAWLAEFLEFVRRFQRLAGLLAN